MVDKITVPIDAETEKADRKIGTLRDKLSKVGSSMKKAAAAGAVGFLGLAAAVGRSVQIYREQEQAEIRTRQTIEATGKAAGLSAEEVFKMASNLQKVTTFGDETILSGQNLLLTFRNIGKDVFPRATEVMLDMSTAMGTDLKSSAIQLGKALNDPTQGISALSRVGITFSEEQKTLIKEMQKAGDTAGAQAVILKELEDQFGGVSRAAAKGTGSIIQTKNVLGDIQESVGKAALPAIKILNTEIIALADSFQSNGSAMKFFKGTLKGVINFAYLAIGVFKGLGGVIGTGLAAAVEAGSQAIKGNFRVAAQIVSDGFSEVGTVIEEANNEVIEKQKAVEEAFAEGEVKSTGSMAVGDPEKLREQAAATQAAIDADNAAKIEKIRAQKEAALSLEAKFAKDLKKLKKTEIKTEKEAELKRKLEDEKARIAEHNREMVDTQRHGKNIAQAKAFFRSKEMQATGMFLDALVTLGQSGSKRLGEIARAGAIAKAIMNTAEGVTKALTFGPFIGPPLAAVIGAAGAVQINTIRRQAFAQGGVVMGGRPGVDSVPIMAQRNELITPTKNYDETVNAVAQERIDSGEIETPDNNVGQGVNVTIGFTEDAFEIIEQKIIERREIGVGLL